MTDETRHQAGCGTGDASETCGSESGEHSYSRMKEKADYVADQFRSTAREVFDTLLRRVPPDVVEHVNNSRKELLLAFRGLIDRELSSIDKCTQRARDLHEKKEEPEETPLKA